MWASHYGVQKTGGKEYERIKEEGNYLGSCLQNEDKGGTRIRILVPIFFYYEFSSQ